MNHFQDTQENQVGQRIYVQSNCLLNNKVIEDRMKQVTVQRIFYSWALLEDFDLDPIMGWLEKLFKELITIRCLKGSSCSCLILQPWDPGLVQGSKLHFCQTSAVRRKKRMVNPPMCGIWLGLALGHSKSSPLEEDVKGDDRKLIQAKQPKCGGGSQRPPANGSTVTEMPGQVQLDPNLYQRLLVYVKWQSKHGEIEELDSGSNDSTSLKANWIWLELSSYFLL